jgi:hypothetical protein
MDYSGVLGKMERGGECWLVLVMMALSRFGGLSSKGRGSSVGHGAYAWMVAILMRCMPLSCPSCFGILVLGA